MSDHRPHNQDHGFNRPLAELLSTYLDDRESLASDELEQVERLLEQDRDAQQAYAELRVISRGLGNLEPISAPRSYHLDAEMVGSPEPVVLQKSSAWYARHAATVRFATAAAAMLFVFVLSADLVLNNVLSDPNGDTNDAFTVEQAEVTGRNSDSDDADAAASDGEGEMEESSGADAGAGDAAPPIVTPEVIEDDDESAAAIQQGGADEEAEDEAPSTLDSSAVESNPEDEDLTADAPESGTGERSNADASDESASNERALTFDEAETGAGDGDSSRRLWRIAEFSLVVLLGLLITAMVILPRLGSGSARSRGE